MTDFGNLLDQLMFNEDETKILVSGAGEKNVDSDNTQVGTIAITELHQDDLRGNEVSFISVSVFNRFESFAQNVGIRLFEGENFSADVEREYIAISPDGTTAFVLL